MLKVSLDIQGDKELVEKLNKTGQSLDDWQPELTKVGDYLINFFQNPVFETEGGIFGKRWLNLKPAYELAKRSLFPGRGILEASGKMRKSFNKEVDPMVLTVANTADYAKFHQFGTRRMPARVIIDVDNSLKDKIVNVLKEGLIEKLRKGMI